MTNIPNLTQEARVLQVLREARSGWVSKRYLVQTMLLSQAGRAVWNLEHLPHWQKEYEVNYFSVWLKRLFTNYKYKIMSKYQDYMLATKLSEADIQKTILEFLGYQKDIYFFRAGSGAVKISDGRYFKTGKKGCGDIIILKQGKFIMVECKTMTGRQTKEQRETEKQVIKCGGYYLVARSVYDVSNFLK